MGRCPWGCKELDTTKRLSTEHMNKEGKFLSVSRLILEPSLFQVAASKLKHALSSKDLENLRYFQIFHIWGLIGIWYLNSISTQTVTIC